MKKMTVAVLVTVALFALASAQPVFAVKPPKPDKPDKSQLELTVTGLDVTGFSDIKQGSLFTFSDENPLCFGNVDGDEFLGEDIGPVGSPLTENKCFTGIGGVGGNVFSFYSQDFFLRIFGATKEKTGGGGRMLTFSDDTGVVFVGGTGPTPDTTTTPAIWDLKVTTERV